MIEQLKLSPTIASRKSVVVDFIARYIWPLARGRGWARSASIGTARRRWCASCGPKGASITSPAWHAARRRSTREQAIRVLRGNGYVVDDPILLVSSGMTNASLHGPPVLDHPSDDEWDSEGEYSEGGSE